MRQLSELPMNYFTAVSHWLEVVTHAKYVYYYRARWQQLYEYSVSILALLSRTVTGLATIQLCEVQENRLI